MKNDPAMRPDFPPLLILRHGETEWNAEGRLQGHHDSPLTAIGIAQAEAQRDVLALIDLSGFGAYASPQGRAFRTAAIALAGLVPEIETDPRLSEIGLGQWAGMKRDEVLALCGLEDGLGFYALAPEGEGFAALEQRCRAFLADLERPAVLVTHGITSRMLRCIALGKDRAELAALPGGQGIVFHLENGIQRQLSNRA
jgi:probable phosphoglycerate mutase